VGWFTITDPNGTQHTTGYDGFERPVQSGMTTPAGITGALSTTRYLGFSGTDPGGRRIVQKVFTDLAAPATAGRSSTVYLDELGCEFATQIDLGADYGGQTLVAGARLYDSLGRVAFEADPFPSFATVNQLVPMATAYGTTRYFRTDGSPRVLHPWQRPAAHDNRLGRGPRDLPHLLPAHLPGQHRGRQLPGR